jgi:hypothetical protein
MKRNMRLVRALLSRIEEDDRLDGAAGFMVQEFEMVGHSPEEVAFHVLLLKDAGMIEGNTETPGVPMIERLTWQGCEFLDDTRDPEIWDKTLKAASAAGIALAWELAKAEIKKKIGLP